MDEKELIAAIQVEGGDGLSYWITAHMCLTFALDWKKARGDRFGRYCESIAKKYENYHSQSGMVEPTFFEDKNYILL
ncbi:MAG: hypothetical protein QNK20_01080 [Aureibaculum sp.]|nr:hypothetical protein [Aureibaculum sp.]